MVLEWNDSKAETIDPVFGMIENHKRANAESWALRFMGTEMRALAAEEAYP